jgi:hypothetical protein
MFSHISRLLTPTEKAPGDAFVAEVNLRDWIQYHLQEVKRCCHEEVA